MSIFKPSIEYEKSCEKTIEHQKLLEITGNMQMSLEKALEQSKNEESKGRKKERKQRKLERKNKETEKEEGNMQK